MIQYLFCFVFNWKWSYSLLLGGLIRSPYPARRPAGGVFFVHMSLRPVQFSAPADDAPRRNWSGSRTDVVNPFQHLKGGIRPEQRLRKVLLGSPVMMTYGTKTDSGQEHLHLGRGGVLGLIRDNVAVVQGSSLSCRARAPPSISPFRNCGDSFPAPIIWYGASKDADTGQSCSGDRPAGIQLSPASMAGLVRDNAPPRRS